MQKSKYILFNIFRNSIITISFLSIFLAPLIINAQEEDKNKIKSSTQMNDESAAKAIVDSFLIALGNNELDKVKAMMLPNANIAYFSTSDGNSIITSISAEQFISRLEGKHRKFKESVDQYTVNISQGKLAFVRADATVYYDDKANHHTNDFFILMKNNDKWKILSGSYTAHSLEK